MSTPRNAISIIALAGFTLLATGSSPDLAEDIAALGDAAESGDGSEGTQWVQQLQAQTELRSGADYVNMAGYGYSLLDVASTDLLPPSGATTIPLSLPIGYEYAVMGVCDNDCSDLDLAVLKDGIELSRDTSTDDWPVVQITPTASSGYEIQVSMHQCSHSSGCGYQLTVWQRPLQTSTRPEIAPDSLSMADLRDRQIWLVNAPDQTPCREMEAAGLRVTCDPDWEHSGDPEIVIWCTEIPHSAAQMVLDHLGLTGFSIRTHQTNATAGGTSECGEVFEITVRWAD